MANSEEEARREGMAQVLRKLYGMDQHRARRGIDAGADAFTKGMKEAQRVLDLHFPDGTPNEDCDQLAAAALYLLHLLEQHVKHASPKANEMLQLTLELRRRRAAREGEK